MKHKACIVSFICFTIFLYSNMLAMLQFDADYARFMRQEQISYVIKAGKLFLYNRDSAGRLSNVLKVDKGRLRPVLPTLAQQDNCRYAICLESKEVSHHGCARYFFPASDMLFNVAKLRLKELGFPKAGICAICKQNL